MKPIYFFLLLRFPASLRIIDLYEFDPRTLNENKISLSDIADDIAYVPLENSFPLGPIYNYMILKKSIYFSSKNVGILVFNREDKNLRKIGTYWKRPR